MEKLHGLKPIVNNKSKVIVLGSYPSTISLKERQYYANPNNQFWRLISDIFHADIRNKDYRQKVNFLLSQKIALWDSLKACKRKGSSDYSISKEVPNDLGRLFSKYPAIDTVCFNGRAAENFYKRYFNFNKRYMYLLSSSPALAKPYKLKKEKWSKILNFLPA